MDTPLQCKNTIQTKATEIYCRLVIQVQPQNSDKEISDICIGINAIELCIDIPDCMTAKEINERLHKMNTAVP